MKAFCIFLVAVCLSCCMTHSSLMKEDIPDVCKLYLECIYYQKKQPDKSACNVFADSCDKILMYNICLKQFPEDLQNRQNCMNILD